MENNRFKQKMMDEFMMNEGKKIMFDFIKDATENNMGAVIFCMEAIRRDQKKAIAGILRMIEIKVKGDKLYMLWNDCCACNFDKTMDVMINNSAEDINAHINHGNGRGIAY